jgi:hypothetical protein
MSTQRFSRKNGGNAKVGPLPTGLEMTAGAVVGFPRLSQPGPNSPHSSATPGDLNRVDAGDLRYLQPRERHSGTANSSLALRPIAFSESDVCTDQKCAR